jgi:hypothetical protein
VRPSGKATPAARKALSRSLPHSSGALPPLISAPLTWPVGALALSPGTPPVATP